MKFIDINKRFTALVAEYISKGYTFNTASMGGSQGEISKVDLTDGTQIIRIYIDTFRDWKRRYSVEGCEIVIGKSTDNVVPNGSNTMDTIWSSHLEVLSRERFYEIGHDRKSGTMYGTLEEAEAAVAKRIARYRARDEKPSDFCPTPEMMAVAKRIVRERMGFKRISESDVRLTKGKHYSVHYRNKCYTLH